MLGLVQRLGLSSKLELLYISDRRIGYVSRISFSDLGPSNPEYALNFAFDKGFG